MLILKIGSETELGVITSFTNKGVSFSKNNQKTFLYFSEVEIALGIFKCVKTA